MSGLWADDGLSAIHSCCLCCLYYDRYLFSILVISRNPVINPIPPQIHPEIFREKPYRYFLLKRPTLGNTNNINTNNINVVIILQCNSYESRTIYARGDELINQGPNHTYIYISRPASLFSITLCGSCSDCFELS